MMFLRMLRSASGGNDRTPSPTGFILMQLKIKELQYLIALLLRANVYTADAGGTAFATHHKQTLKLITLSRLLILQNRDAFRNFM